jgi:hypothetical protein
MLLSFECAELYIDLLPTNMYSTEPQHRNPENEWDNYPLGIGCGTQLNDKNYDWSTLLEIVIILFIYCKTRIK